MSSKHARVILGVLLTAVLPLTVCQLFPKFSGTRSGGELQPSPTERWDATPDDGHGPLSSFLSLWTRRTIRTPFYQPDAPVSGGHSITFRLSVTPSEDAALSSEVASVQDVSAGEEDVRRAVSRVHRAMSRAERLQRANQTVLYKEAAHDISRIVSSQIVQSRELNQALTVLLNKLAVRLCDQGQARDALNALSLSLACFDRSVLDRETSEDSVRRARIVSNMGSVAMQDTDFSTALMYFHDVLLKMLGNYDQFDLSAASLIGKTYTRLGGVYMALNDLPQAIFHYNEAAKSFHGVYSPLAVGSAADIGSYARSVELMFADSLNSTKHSQTDFLDSSGHLGSPACSCSELLKTEEAEKPCVCDCENASPGSVLTAAAADRVRHIVVGFIAMLVTASGLMALFPVENSALGGVALVSAEVETADAATGTSPIKSTPQKALSPSKVQRRRNSGSKSVGMRTPDPSSRSSARKAGLLPEEDRAFFAAVEKRAMEHLRDMEYECAEIYLTNVLKDKFSANTPTINSAKQIALSVVECRLRYMLSKAKMGLEKFQEGEQELYSSIDLYLKIGVLDDITVAAMLDYSLTVIREQLYDDDGAEKFTPDRFVRAHNVFCSLLFSPDGAVGKSFSFQKFQVSGPVDSDAVQTYGLMSPACVKMLSTTMNSPLFCSPVRTLRTASDEPMVVGKYDNDNDMLKSLERLFYQSNKRKEEYSTIALMCSEFEDLAEEMDKCLNTEDFCIRIADEDVGTRLCARSVDFCSEKELCATVDKTCEHDMLSDSIECPNTNAIETRLGSTTGDGFDGDTFDDLLLGQDEEGDVSRVQLVNMQQSPESTFCSPSHQREYSEQDSASFESPPYLHMRHGMAMTGHSSETKENNHCVSMAGTDGYLTDNSNRASETKRNKRKSKGVSPPSKNKPIR